MSTNTKVKTEKKAGRGRPSNVKKIILQNSIHMQNKTDKELVSYLLEKTPIRSFMKEADDNIISRNLYVSVRTARKESLAKGKKVAFKGRKVGTELKMKWLHSPKKKIAENASPAPAETGE